MSDRPCNHCVLKGIKRRAKAAGKEVTVRSNNVYVHPPDVDPKKPKPVGDGEICSTLDLGENEYFVAWLMSIPDHCCC